MIRARHKGHPEPVALPADYLEQLRPPPEAAPPPSRGQKPAAARDTSKARQAPSGKEEKSAREPMPKSSSGLPLLIAVAFLALLAWGMFYLNRELDLFGGGAEAEQAQLEEEVAPAEAGAPSTEEESVTEAPAIAKPKKGSSARKRSTPSSKKAAKAEEGASASPAEGAAVRPEEPEAQDQADQDEDATTEEGEQAPDEQANPESALGVVVVQGAILSVRLAGNGRNWPQGAVPPGDYRVAVAFAQGETARLPGLLTVAAGQTVVVSCDDQELACHVVE